MANTIRRFRAVNYPVKKGRRCTTKPRNADETVSSAFPNHLFPPPTDAGGFMACTSVDNLSLNETMALR